jgi:integrase/recombinase XerC
LTLLEGLQGGVNDDGNNREEASMNWNKAVDAYLRSLSSGTARQYGAALGEFARWYLKRYREEPDPALLTREEAREYRTYLDGRNLRASTVNVRLSAIKGLVRSCGRTIEVESVRRVEQPVEPLNARELGRLLAVVEGDGWMERRNAALIGIMVRAGLRVSEAVALNVEDTEINERSGWVLVRRGKGRKERRIPLSLEARKELAVYLEVRPGAKDTGALFLSKSHRRLQSRAVQRMVAGAAHRAGVSDKRVTPHVLRHSFATRFLRKGGDLATLRDLLGHRSLETTSRYLHPDAARVQEMVEEL